MLTDALRGGARSAGAVVTAQARTIVNSLQGMRTNRASSMRRRCLALSPTAAFCTGAAIILCAGLGQKDAKAQAIPAPAQRDFDIKVGVFIPASTEVRTAGATLIPEVEGNYTIQKFPESSFVSQLGVGYIEHGNFRMIPLTVSQIYRDPNNSSSVNYYYGLGLGLYSTRLNLPDTDDRVKLLFGGFIVTGLDFTKTIFGELKYNYISKYDNKETGGFQIAAGVRF